MNTQARQATPDAAPVLELRGISKSFGSVRALKEVSVAFAPGEVHAIVGENGAGKSTLIAIAAGVLMADAGEIVRDGARIAEPDPREMRERGLSVAYQHPALAPHLTVLENLQLVAPALRGADGPAEARRLIAMVATEPLQMDVGWRVSDLSLAQQHVVEIARALATNPRVLFLDEPTEPFQQNDVRKLFDLIKRLRDQGVTIVYVSHRLHEVTELADRISVLRDGELIATRRAAEISMAEIVTAIAGRPLGQIFPPKSAAVGEPLLEIRNLSGPGFDEASLVARAGEIVGLAGIEGQGQREFLRAVVGVGRRRGGEVLVKGRRVSANSPHASRAAGIGFVPDDRHAEGLFLNLPIRENIGLGNLARILKRGVVQRAKEAEIGRAVAAGLNVRAASIEVLVVNLSGGNQQKVLFGREMSGDAAVLMVDEPTRGVDIGARTEIYKQLRDLADRGMAIVVSSSDGVELEGLCDRVLIFARGRIVRELTGGEVTDTGITEANMTATVSRAQQAAGRDRQGRLRDLLASDHFPAVVLAAVTAFIVIGTNAINPFFLSEFSIASMLNLLSILALISLAQLCVLLVGAIDLSVGPLAGLAVVLASFFLPRGATPEVLIGGSLAILAISLVFGFIQGLVVTGLRLPSIVVTLASFIGLQGISLLLRPRPSGTISDALSENLSFPLFDVLPASLVLTVLLLVALEWTLYRRPLGRQQRAIGSDAAASHKLGVSQRRGYLIAFTAAGGLTGMAGLILAGQVGIGSATTGADYTLQSITAVVLGGAAIAGGRGSFLCTMLGAMMVQSIISASSFLNADSSYHYTAVGALTLIAAVLFSLARRGRVATARAAKA
ncbi:MAG: ATP-binding cassette domain-containing protein [Alphaproteobacteria bacterium]